MTNEISTYNQLESKSIELILDRTPMVDYFCTSASVPGISATAVRQPSPFTDIKVTGDKLVYQPLIVNMIVDENMDNWSEIFNWLVSYAHPTEFEEYQNSNVNQNYLYRSKLSGAKLLIPNNKYNRKHEFTFVDVFPIDMSDLIFDTQIDGTTVVVCTVTFDYTTYSKTA